MGQWYDILVLPPSFPFGGMENPRLTFATPTVIAGDKSLVALVAHELAAVQKVADHVYLIANGKVVAQGAPDSLVHDGSPWTAQFFGGEADGPVPFQYPAGDYATELGFPGGKA